MPNGDHPHKGLRGTVRHADDRPRYPQICAHCGKAFLSLSRETKYMPGHAPKKRGFKLPPTPAQLKLIETRIPDACRVPTVADALAKRPEACQKCGSSMLQEALIEELVRANNGQGVGWRCVMCGWQTMAWPILTKAQKKMSA